MTMSWLTNLYTKYKNVISVVGISIGSALFGGAVSQHVFTPAVSYSVVVSTPSTVNVGDMVECSATVQNLSWFNNKPTMQWQVVEATAGETNFKQTDQNGVFFVAAPASTKYYVVTTASSYKNYYLWGYEQGLGTYINDITVNGGPTPPNPTPTPIPTPTPTIPDGKFAIAKVAYDNFPTIPNRATLAAALATNYTTVQTQIAAGTIVTTMAAFQQLKTSNAATLKAQNVSADTVSGWASTVQSKIYDLYNAKKMVKLSDYGDLFGEIASGLSFVK